jgi:hypothetical protein
MNVVKLRLINRFWFDFFIGKYSDVVLMHEGYLLLGSSWRFDRKVVYDGF